MTHPLLKYSALDVLSCTAVASPEGANVAKHWVCRVSVLGIIMMVARRYFRSENLDPEGKYGHHINLTPKPSGYR